MHLITRYMTSRPCFKMGKQVLSCGRLAPLHSSQYTKKDLLTSKSRNNNNLGVFARNFCSDGLPQEEKKSQLMEFPEIVWPSLWHSIRNWMFANFIIRPHLDREFNITDFVDASKQAVEVISNALSESDFETLKGLVSEEAYQELKTSVSSMSVAQREQLQVFKEDIYFAFVYQVGVMFDDTENRFVEITMCYHGLKGLKAMLARGESPPMSMGMQEEYQGRLFVCNYRFVRDYTKGKEDSSWLVNVANHFKPVDTRRPVE